MMAPQISFLMPVKELRDWWLVRAAHKSTVNASSAEPVQAVWSIMALFLSAPKIRRADFSPRLRIPDNRFIMADHTVVSLLDSPGVHYQQCLYSLTFSFSAIATCHLSIPLEELHLEQTVVKRLELHENTIPKDLMIGKSDLTQIYCLPRGDDR